MYKRFGVECGAHSMSYVWIEAAQDERARLCACEFQRMENYFDVNLSTVGMHDNDERDVRVLDVWRKLATF